MARSRILWSALAVGASILFTTHYLNTRGDRAGIPSMGSFLQDVRYGLRNLARNPGFALVAMLTLALGIGANTTIFSVINDTILKPIPFPEPDRMVLVLETFGGKGDNNWNIVSA